MRYHKNFNANVHGRAEPLYLALPGYTFATPVLGGQFNLSAAFAYGRIESSVDATIMGNLGLGGPGFTVGRSLTETSSGFGDILPMASLRWNFGVHNFMTYLTGNLTTGVYHSQSIANVGIGHNAIVLAVPILTSTRRPDTNFPPHSASLTTSKTRTRITRTASTCIWIGVHRNS
jgi:hypothetical protein